MSLNEYCIKGEGEWGFTPSRHLRPYSGRKHRNFRHLQSGDAVAGIDDDDADDEDNGKKKEKPRK